MKSYSVCYVKDKTFDEMSRLNGDGNRLRMDFSSVNDFPDSPWLECGFNKDDYAPDDSFLFGEASLIQEKSEKYGEMIFLHAGKPDFFYYEHACNGVLLRKLAWLPLLDDFGTPGWICVQGETEPWELDTFFEERRLEYVIKQERDFYAMEKDFDTFFPAHEVEIRKLWESRQIVANMKLPSCDWTVVQCVEKAFGLKHKEDPWA